MLKFVKNITSLGIVQLVNYIFPLLTVPYISRIIGPDGYGIINYVTSFVTYFTLLISYGFDLSATRKIVLNPLDIKKRSEVFSEVFSARIYLFLLSFFFFLFAILVLDPLKKDLRITFLLYLNCISVVYTPQYIYQGLQELTVFAKVNFIRGLISTVFIFLLINEPKDYVWLVVINVLLSLFSALFFLVHAYRKFDLNFSFQSFSKIKTLLWEERMLFFSNVFISLYTITNTFLLGFFDSIKNVAFFTISQSFISMISTVLTVPFATAFFPYIGNSFSVSKEKGIEVVRQILPIIFYLLFTCCFCLFAASSIIIELIYGKQFVNAVFPLKIMSFLPLIISFSNLFGIQIMINLGMDKIFFRIISVCSIVGLICSTVMSYFFGYIGAAWNILLVESLVTLVMFLALSKKNINVFELKYFRVKNIFCFIKSNIKI